MAQRLRWAVVPICIILSSCVSITATLASLAVALSTFLHNELGLHAHSWFTRNLLNGLGLASYELGATAVTSRFLIT